MTQPNQCEDKELREATQRSVALLVAQRRGADKWDEQDLVTAGNILFVCSRLITQKQLEAEAVSAFMATSAILTEMSPLMVHRLERGFPEMTAEVIGNVYEQVKKEMKPYQDKRKAELTKRKGK